MIAGSADELFHEMSLRTWPKDDDGYNENATQLTGIRKL